MDPFRLDYPFAGESCSISRHTTQSLGCFHGMRCCYTRHTVGRLLQRQAEHTGKDCKHNKQIHGISWTLSLNKREPCRQGACAICCWSASYYSAQIELLIQFDWQSLLWVQLCSAFDSATEFDWAWFQNVGLAGLVNLTCSQKGTKRFIWFLKRDPRSHLWSWTGSL